MMSEKLKMQFSTRERLRRVGVSGLVFVFGLQLVLAMGVSLFFSQTPVVALGGCPRPIDHPVTTTIVQNGDFSTQPSDTFLPSDNPNLGRDNSTYHDYADAHFTSQTANVGSFVYPRDTAPLRNQLAIQKGPIDLPIEGVSQLPFPGDAAFGVPLTEYWYYSNGNAIGSIPGADEYINWEQDVSGLKPNTDYIFVAYISSVVEPAYAAPDDPIMSLRIGGTHGKPDGPKYLNNVRLDEVSTQNSAPLNGWRRIAAAFNTGVTGTSPFLKITDSSTGYLGDDFGMAAISLQECTPIDDKWKPIMRTYGNDVVAGGGYTDDLGNVCLPSGPVSVTMPPFVHGLGNYVPAAPQNHATYVGSGSELGVFAEGDITGFLPGAGMNAPRSKPWELSFANTITGGSPIDTNEGTYQFGGGFANSGVFCPHYPTPSSPTVLPITGNINLGSLAVSGDYVMNAGGQHLFGTLPIGVHARLFVAGDVLISNDILYAGAGGGWSSTSQIPRLEVFSTSNIDISEDVHEISGVFKAMGNLSTCVARNGTQLWPGKAPDHFSPAPVGDHEDYILTRCRNKLLVYGSLTAERLYAYRSTKQGLDLAQVAEPYTSANLSEALVFSPETYISFLPLSFGPVSTGKLDSIVSLPPTY